MYALLTIRGQEVALRRFDEIEDFHPETLCAPSCARSTLQRGRASLTPKAQAKAQAKCPFPVIAPLSTRSRIGIVSLSFPKPSPRNSFGTEPGPRLILGEMNGKVLSQLRISITTHWYIVNTEYQ